MNPFPSAHPFADTSFSFQDQKIVRDQTYVVAESDYQISARETVLFFEYFPID